MTHVGKIVSFLVILVCAGVLFLVYKARESGGQKVTKFVAGNFERNRPNDLARSNSPYLRTAMYQPVNWHEYEESAFRLAEQMDRPVLLDIGAVWCHWCHVMDRESYENTDVADMINSLFVAIKVDRDLRPDIDFRYQRAVSVLTGGQGGWPLTAFLTPSGKVFFGGTYFPREDRSGRPGLKTLLPRIYETYKQNKTKILADADTLYNHLATLTPTGTKKDELNQRLVGSVLNSIIQNSDPVNGGSKGRPKFPNGRAIELLLTSYFKERDNKSLQAAQKALDGMARGGIHDHIGGGFHRYAIDEKWRIPHFEKMTYVNSELLKAYLHAYQAIGSSSYKDVAEGILSYVNGVASDQEQGGFYSTQDADVGINDDGSYYTWTYKEIKDALSREEADVLIPYFNVRENPNDLLTTADRNVLTIAKTEEEIAKSSGLSLEKVKALVASAKKKLLAIRSKKPAPFIDKNKFTNWNAMMLSAYFEAYRILGRDELKQFALKSLNFFLDKSYQPGKGMYHTYFEGKPNVTGLLDDQVQMAYALLDAYELTEEKRYLDAAEDMMEYAYQNFWDKSAGGFLDAIPAGNAPEPLRLKNKPVDDTPTPGSNPAAAIVLDKLYYLTGEEKYRQRAEATLEAFAGAASGFGPSASTYGLAVNYHINHPAQVVIVGRRSNPQTLALWKAALSAYRPEKIVLLHDIDHAKTNKRLAPSIATVVQNAKLDGQPQAYICIGSVCSPPTNSPEKITELLRTFSPSPPSEKKS